MLKWFTLVSSSSVFFSLLCTFCVIILSFALLSLALSRSYNLCVCVCDFFLFRRGIYVCVCVFLLLAGWLHGSLDRSIDRSFDRLIDSSVGGSRVTLSSFLSWCPLSLNYLYICILCSQSSHLKFWYISHSFFLDFGLFIIFCFFGFVQVMLPVFH